jgi:hypothetical protein
LYILLVDWPAIGERALASILVALNLMSSPFESAEITPLVRYYLVVVAAFIWLKLFFSFVCKREFV